MGTFITSRRALEFTNPGTGEKFLIPNRFLGEVPDWVTADWAFQAAVDDASITYVGSKHEPDEKEAANGPESDLQDLREQAKALGIPNASRMGRYKLLQAIAESIKNGDDGVESEDAEDGDPIEQVQS